MKLEDNVTPTYIYDVDAFRTNAKDVISIVRSHYPNFRLAYSYKTNYFRPFIDEAKRLGLYAEVVSPQEFYVANEIREKLQNIIYNGVIDDFHNKWLVANKGGIVNIENMPEMMKFVHYTNSSKETMEVGIRINIDLENGLTSRFGFDVDGKDFEWLCDQSNHPYLKFKCVHFQFGGSAGGLRTPEMFRNRVRKCVAIARQLNAKIVDVGGNIIGRLSADYLSQFHNTPPTMENVCNAIGKEMAAVCPQGDIELIAECGSALVTNAMHLLTTITNINVVRGKAFITCDCRKSDVGWSANRYDPSNLYFGKSGQSVIDAVVCGCECREEDVLIRKYTGPASVGGKLLIKNIGAYSYSVRNNFITPGCQNVIDIKKVDF